MPPDASLIIPFDTSRSRKPRTLLDDVQQIVKQKGAFRHVSEAKLHLGSIEPIDPEDVVHSDHTTDTELETTQETQKRLFTTRNEVIKLYQTSLNEINTLLDLVSWLLSAKSKVAQTTMSPALKGGVPVGSAEIKAVPPPELTQSTQQRFSDTSSIVRLQAFAKSSAQLLAASKRLDTEAQHQSKYWDQMAEIRSKGWPVSRLPRDARTLVAHVASTEAAPRHRSKGLIPFRRNEHGNLTIPSTQGAVRELHLAVTVRRGDKVTGFHQGHKESLGGRSQLESALIQAKERVFEEELFNEASREAQLIASMGVKVRSSSIEVDLTPQCATSITYLPFSSDRAVNSHGDDDIAAFVDHSLRAMLVAEHEVKYQMRSQRSPAPMVLNPRPSSECVLIRPIISQLRHYVNVFPVLQILRSYQTTLELAGLPFSIDSGSGSEDETLVGALQSLRQTTKSLVKINLPSGRSVELNIETQLAPPRFGTQYRSTQYKNASDSRTLQATSSFKAAVTFVDDVLARDVCDTVLQSKPYRGKWDVLTHSPLELVLIENGKPQALLAASCYSGNLAISCLQTKAGITEKLICGKAGSILVDKSGQRKEVKKSVNAVIGNWVKHALD